MVRELFVLVPVYLQDTVLHGDLHDRWLGPQDVERGRRLGSMRCLGSVVELGRITDTPTPTLDAIYAATRLLDHVIELRGSGIGASS